MTFSFSSFDVCRALVAAVLSSYWMMIVVADDAVAGSIISIKFPDGINYKGIITEKSLHNNVVTIMFKEVTLHLELQSIENFFSCYLIYCLAATQTPLLIFEKNKVHKDNNSKSLKIQNLPTILDISLLIRNGFLIKF